MIRFRTCWKQIGLQGTKPGGRIGTDTLELFKRMQFEQKLEETLQDLQEMQGGAAATNAA